MMPTEEWFEKYRQKRESLCCPIDLESCFTEKKIGKDKVDTLNIGSLHLPTGAVVTCDPLTELGEALPFVQTVPAGTYPVSVCVWCSDACGNRYSCVKVAVSDRKPVRYEMGLTGIEDLDQELEKDECFGFFVDTGMGCIADLQTQEAFQAYWDRRMEADPDINCYDDLFCDLLEENAAANPAYNESPGDWLNWTVPETGCNVAMFSSGWGDGSYPTYFGYDAGGKVCGIYILFIDIAGETEDDEQEENPETGD